MSAYRRLVLAGAVRRAVFAVLCASGAVRQVRHTDELSVAVITCLRDANLRDSMGASGSALVEQNRGALDKLMTLLVPYIDAD